MSQLLLLPGRRTERRQSYSRNIQMCKSTNGDPASTYPFAIISKSWCYLLLKVEFLFEVHLIMFLVYKKEVTEGKQAEHLF